jgi:aerobic carbon-monoxide dehydrogenase medium subunit
VIPAAFEYEAPTTVDEALAALAKGGNVKVLAGGQSLIPMLRLRMASPATLVDLNRIPALRGVRDDGDAIVIGAMTTHDDVTREPLVLQHALLLAKATQTVADPQVRHRGTVGGSVSHADPAQDTPAAILALDASMVIAGPNGRRTVAAADFFKDLFTTDLGEGDLLVEVRIPKHTGWGAAYVNITRTAQSWSIVGVAATIRVTGGTVAEAKVALTNMGLIPIRARAVEAALVGGPATAEAVRAAAAQAAVGTSPMADSNADAEYRTHLAQVLSGRAVLAAAGV